MSTTAWFVRNYESHTIASDQHTQLIVFTSGSEMRPQLPSIQKCETDSLASFAAWQLSSNDWMILCGLLNFNEEAVPVITTHLASFSIFVIHFYALCLSSIVLWSFFGSLLIRCRVLWVSEFLRSENVGPTPNAHTGGPGYLSFSGTSFKTCPAMIALQAARQPLAWLSNLIVDAVSVTRLDMASVGFLYVTATWIRNHLGSKF
jgi:hypothetical protein